MQLIHEFHGLGIPSDVPLLGVNPVQLAPDVYHIFGSSHHSMVVEQANGIVLIEPPLYPECSAEIIA